MVSVVLLAAYLYFRFNVLDKTYLVELFLILGLGGISLKMHNSTLFKFQPMATGIIFASYGFYLQFLGTPFLLKIEPMLDQVAEPQMRSVIKSEAGRSLFSSMSLELSILILIHACACGYAAYKMSSLAWLLTRLTIYPLLLGYLLIRWVPFLVSQGSQ